MRKIFFIIFGLVLLALILLVDWREKWDTLTRRSLTEAEPFPTVNQDATVDSMIKEWTTGDPNLAAFPEEPLSREVADDPSTAAWRSQGPPGPSLRSLPASPQDKTGPMVAPWSFQDMPEQPYLDESRQLLKQTVRNYERIVPPPAKPHASERRP